MIDTEFAAAMNTENWPDGDLLQEAWGIIANAGEGNWEKETPEWQAAVVRWRDSYHRRLVERYPTNTDLHES